MFLELHGFMKIPTLTVDIKNNYCKIAYINLTENDTTIITTSINGYSVELSTDENSAYCWITKDNYSASLEALLSHHFLFNCLGDRIAV